VLFFVFTFISQIENYQKIKSKLKTEKYMAKVKFIYSVESVHCKVEVCQYFAR